MCKHIIVFNIAQTEPLFLHDINNNIIHINIKDKKLTVINAKVSSESK